MRRILIADDYKANCELLSSVLHGRYETRCVYDGIEVLTALQAGRYDCILLDQLMPRMDGFQILARLSERGLLADTPVVMITSAVNDAAYRQALAGGAVDVISRPYDGDTIRRRVDYALKLRDGELDREGYDRLLRDEAGPGLPNREQFSQAVREQLISNIPGALMAIDIDNMQYINMTYGQQEGDRAVAALGELLRASFDRPAIIGHMSGDEFGVYLPAVTERPRVRHYADSLLRAVRKKIALPDKLHVLSISIGVALYPEHASDFGALFAAADSALTYVKNNDRNAYRIYDRRDDLQAKQQGRMEYTYSEPESLLKARDDENKQAWVRFGEFRLIWDGYRRFTNPGHKVSCTLLTIRNLKGAAPQREDVELVRANITGYFQARETLGVFTWYSLNELLMIHYGGEQLPGLIDELRRSISNELMLLSLGLEEKTIEY